MTISTTQAKQVRAILREGWGTSYDCACQGCKLLMEKDRRRHCSLCGFRGTFARMGCECYDEDMLYCSTMPGRHTGNLCPHGAPFCPVCSEAWGECGEAIGVVDAQVIIDKIATAIPVDFEAWRPDDTDGDRYDEADRWEYIRAIRSSLRARELP